jgi:predicted exporter
MNHESDMSLESDLRALLPETLSDEAAFALVEALYAMVGALESIYFVQIRRHVARLDRSAQSDLFDDLADRPGNDPLPF